MLDSFSLLSQSKFFRFFLNFDGNGELIDVNDVEAKGNDALDTC
jgi:hypothetical protein